MRLHFSNSYQAIFKFELANFKRAVGHSFCAGRLLEDTRVCTKCRRILFMLVSKATKLLKLGHSDFDQVYAMGPWVSPSGSKGDTPGSVMAGRAHGIESSGVRAWGESARPRGSSGMSGWQAQSESAHEGWGPEGLVFPRAARGRVRLLARWIT